MTDFLLDLPDHLLVYVMQMLPTARALLNASEVCKALHELATSDSTVWQPLSSSLAWVLRRRRNESCLEHFKRSQEEGGATLVVIGGDTYGNTDAPSIDVFDVKTQTWMLTPAPEFSTWREAPAAACDGGCIYTIGGWDEDENEALDSLETLRVPRIMRLYGGDDDDAEVQLAEEDEGAEGRSDGGGGGGGGAGGRRWERDAFWGDVQSWTMGTLPNMSQARCFAAAAFDAQQRLWVVGGGTGMTRGAQCLRSVAFVDTKRMGEADVEWQDAGVETLVPRCGHAVAADGRSSTLYVCGGYSGGLTYQDTVETLDLECTRGPQVLAALASPCSGCGAGVGPDGALYVVGGSEDGSRMLSDFQRHDPRRGRWENLAGLPTARGYLSAAFAPDGCLYAAGGCSGKTGTYSDRMDAFDARAGKWRTAPPMPFPRSSHALELAFAA
jgi:hypothetical protein